MKTTHNPFANQMRVTMKSIEKILKNIEEEETKVRESMNKKEYINASLTNCERFYDLMERINLMANDAADLYNLYATDYEKWMTAKATYKLIDKNN